MSDDSASSPSGSPGRAPRKGTGHTTPDADPPRTAVEDVRGSANPAISDDTVQRYYYIYDSRAGRPLVQDRLTQAPYVWDDDPRAPVLRYAAASGEELRKTVERRFALWCARQVTEAFRSETQQDEPSLAADNMTDKLIQAAEDLVESPESTHAQSVRSAAENDVIHASTIGLSEMDPAAAALLTAFGATHPDPRTAALEAAHMSERYAEFVAYHRHNGADLPLPSVVRQRTDRRTGSHDDTPVPDAAARLMREAHIDWLLDEV